MTAVVERSTNGLARPEAGKRRWSGATLWSSWNPEGSAALVKAFTAIAPADVRLVLSTGSVSALDAAGRSLAAAFGATGSVLSGHGVFLTASPPSIDDLRHGQHAFIGTGLPAADGVRVVHDADRPGRLEEVLGKLSHPLSGPRTGLLATGRIVAIHFMGRLGNQLFQYAAARAIADRTGAALVADLRWFPHQHKARWELDDYRVRLDAVIRQDSDWATIGSPPLRHYPEQGFRFDPGVLELQPGVLMTGYYQSPQYFADDVDAIRSDLELSTPLSPWARATAATIDGLDCPVSLHVRRGDYVNDTNVQTVHGTCSAEYYRRAVALLARVEPDLDVLTFSDDPQWAAANIAPQHTRTSTTVQPPPGSSAAENLYLMSKVRHAVMANSSFSWWGAWLRDDDGIVVAPRPWFQAEMDTRDLLPADWLTVDAR